MTDVCPAELDVTVLADRAAHAKALLGLKKKNLSKASIRAISAQFSGRSRVLLKPSDISGILQLHPEALNRILTLERERSSIYLRESLDLITRFLVGHPWPSPDDHEADRIFVALRSQAPAFNYQVLPAPQPKKRPRAPQETGLRGDISLMQQWYSKRPMLARGIRTTEDAIKIYESTVKRTKAKHPTISPQKAAKILGYDPYSHTSIDGLQSILDWSRGIDSRTYLSITDIRQAQALMSTPAVEFLDDRVEAGTDLRFSGWRVDALGRDIASTNSCTVHPLLLLDAAEVAFKKFHDSQAGIQEVAKWKPSTIRPLWYRQFVQRADPTIPVVSVLRFLVHFNEDGTVASTDVTPDPSR